MKSMHTDEKRGDKTRAASLGLTDTHITCILYTYDAADEPLCVDLDDRAMM